MDAFKRKYLPFPTLITEDEPERSMLFSRDVESGIISPIPNLYPGKMVREGADLPVPRRPKPRKQRT